MRLLACILLLALSPLAVADGEATRGREAGQSRGEPVAAERPAIDLDALDPAKSNPARLVKAGRMLEATRFGAMYDTVLTLAVQRPLPEGASDEAIRDRRLKDRLAGLVRWRDVAPLWSAAFASALSDEELDAISVFHEGPVGRAIAECAAAAVDLQAISACQMPADEKLRAEVSAFKASPTGAAFEVAGSRMAEQVMIHALRLALVDEPDAAAALAEKCRRDAADAMCASLSPATR